MSRTKARIWSPRHGGLLPSTATSVLHRIGYEGKYRPRTVTGQWVNSVPVPWASGGATRGLRLVDRNERRRHLEEVEDQVRVTEHVDGQVRWPLDSVPRQARSRRRSVRHPIPESGGTAARRVVLDSQGGEVPDREEARAVQDAALADVGSCFPGRRGIRPFRYRASPA